MKATEVCPEETRIAKELMRACKAINWTEEEIEKNLNEFPLSPFWWVANLIRKKQEEKGIKII